MRSVLDDMYLTEIYLLLVHDQYNGVFSQTNSERHKICAITVKVK